MGDADTVRLRIDGREVQAAASQTVWEAARDAGISIPALCHDPRLHPAGVCRVCVVEVEGARTLVASCMRKVEAGMNVSTCSDRVLRTRRTLVELLMADHPSPCERQRRDGACELETLAASLDVEPRLPARRQSPVADLSSPVIAVDHAACILCDRCIRACNQVQANLVIGRTGKGATTRIGFDLDQPMGRSSCVSCGECSALCPTGALTDKPLSRLGEARPEHSVDSVCPYCGVGCSLRYHVSQNRIVAVEGRLHGHSNRGRLCVKGRYGYDYVEHPERLTRPLIRRDGAAKGHPPADPREAFRDADWDEALDVAARGLMEVKQRHGSQAMAGFGSAKCSNEDNYLFQKLVRAVFGTNNVDHCTRLCHASSVAALLETVGSGAVSNMFTEVELADCALVVGSNTTENHPVAASFIKQAAGRGTCLIVIDPRRPQLADHARHYLRPRPGTDVALLNGLMHLIVEQGLVDRDFVNARTEGFSELEQVVADYTPRRVQAITGVPEADLQAVALAYGRARSAITFWGMGVSQHTTGTDNARSLISLCLMTGNVGRPGTGLHPLRGQNNVQGASDVGLIPMVYTDYQPVADPTVRAKFEQAWGVELDPSPGLTVVEILEQALEGRIRGMYMMGENPFLSDPNMNKVEKALASLEFLVVQDIFLTETAAYADVVLPATAHAEKTGTYTNSNRLIQLGRKAVEPPGQARSDWTVVAELASRMGYPMSYASEEQIWEEIRSLSPSVAGISYPRLSDRGVVWPCLGEDREPQEVLFGTSFPRGRGRFVPVRFAPADELPDERFPYVLNTGRVLEHWHTRSMTKRSKALHTLKPGPFVEMHPKDMQALGVAEGETVRVSSRRGSISLPALSSLKSHRASVFIPFHFVEAAANLLTNDALDPHGKIPEFKFCAVRVERA
jgi:formate dehydrogenase major subunit